VTCSRGEQPLLFQVLNEMDGLGDDADIAFLLTTNRADLLEPALVQRPGRVDLAVEIPVPDAEGRARLPCTAPPSTSARTSRTRSSPVRRARRPPSPGNSYDEPY
jgi:hypothetical protein